MSDNKKCSYCKKTVNKNLFFRIKKKQTYGLESDENGYVFYKIPTKLCQKCRNYLYDRKKKLYTTS